MFQLFMFMSLCDIWENHMEIRGVDKCRFVDITTSNDFYLFAEKIPFDFYGIDANTVK